MQDWQTRFIKILREHRWKNAGFERARVEWGKNGEENVFGPRTPNRSGLPRSPGGVENRGALLHYLSRPIRFARGGRIVRSDERGRSGEVCRKSRPGQTDGRSVVFP